MIIKFNNFLKESINVDNITISKIEEKDIPILLDLKYNYFKKYYYNIKYFHDNNSLKNMDLDLSFKMSDGDKIIGGYFLKKYKFNPNKTYFYDVTPLMNKNGLRGISLFIDNNYRNMGLGQKFINYVMDLPYYDFMVGGAFHRLSNINKWMERRYLIDDYITIGNRVYLTLETNGIELEMTSRGENYKKNHPNLNWNNITKGFIK